MAHYRQATGKAAEKFYEQAAGQIKVQDFAHVPDGIGYFGVENGEKMTPDSAPFRPSISSVCNENPCDSRVGKNAPSYRQGLEPNPASAGNCSMKRQLAKSAVAETVALSENPSDLQKIINNWDALPAEIKQTILTLVKHSR